MNSDKLGYQAYFKGGDWDGRGGKSPFSSITVDLQKKTKKTHKPPSTRYTSVLDGHSHPSTITTLHGKISVVCLCSVTLIGQIRDTCTARSAKVMLPFLMPHEFWTFYSYVCLKCSSCDGKKKYTQRHTSGL